MEGDVEGAVDWLRKRHVDRVGGGCEVIKEDTVAKEFAKWCV